MNIRFKELLHLMVVIASLEQDVHTVNRCVNNLVNLEIEKDLFDKGKLDTAGDFRHGRWICDETSPTNYCIYDHILDPPHDNCLYCGQPEERK